MNSPKRLSAAPLLARVVLLEIVSSLDGTGVSLFLYPLVPFSAAFSFGLRAGNILGLLGLRDRIQAAIYAYEHGLV